MIWGLDVEENLVYIAQQAAGLQIYNISDPQSIFYIGGYDATFNDSHSAMAVVVQENYAYVAAYDSVECFDISDTASPTLVGHLDLTGQILSIVIQENVAYVVANQNGMYCINITNPNSLELLGSCATYDLATGIFVSGDVVYVADGEKGLICIDVADPTNPTELSTIECNDWAWSVDVYNNTAFIADNNQGLLCIDVTDPANPEEIGSWMKSDPVCCVCYVKVINGIALLGTQGSGLVCLNVSNPADIIPISTYSFTGDCYGIDVSNNKTYLAVQKSPDVDFEIVILNYDEILHPLPWYIENYYYLIAGIMGIIVFAVVIATYQKKQKESRRIRKEQEELRNIIRDELGIQSVLLVHKINGVLLNSRLYHNAEFSATLVAGFLSGIASWEQIITTEKSEQKGLDEMKYGSFTVTLKHGKIVDIAAFSRYPLCATVAKRLQNVVNFVEEKFAKELASFDGEIGRFESINEEIDLKLGTNHQGEFTVNTKNATFLDLTPEILAELDHGAMLVEKFYLNELIPLWKEKKLVKDEAEALVMFAKFIEHQIFVPVEQTAAKSINAETMDLMKKNK